MEENCLPDLGSALSVANRPIRLRLWTEHGASDDLLLVKHVSGIETICGGIEYSLLCIATKAGLPLKQFIAMPAELQFVTANGHLRPVCGIVTRAVEGESDGGLATYQLIMRDALAILEKRNNTRVFRHASEVDITDIVLNEWRKSNALLARAFDFDLGRLKSYPAREFTMQYNESDAAFLRRLWKRRGLAWFIEAGASSAKGDQDIATHTLVLFDDVWSLRQNGEGSVRYHRDDGTETSDCITAWHAARTLVPGKVSRRSWDYKQAWSINSQHDNDHPQGALGDQLAASLDDYLVDVPHAGDNGDDYRSLGALLMQRHEYDAKCFQGESGDRELRIGQWKSVSGHAELDTHAQQEREFVFTELRIDAENNLPKTLNDRVRRLFALNHWHHDSEQLQQASAERGARYSNRFSCVRRGIPIVPAYDTRTDLPHATAQSVTVVGPEDSVVHCDEQGRVKIRFPACRPEDHAHAQGAGASGGERDSAWVRVASSWAGESCGAISLPRVGDEVIITFLGGDPDKMLISGRVHGGKTPPPAFNRSSRLPAEKYLSGIVSQEIGAQGYNQLRFDDSPGQVSAQLASDHGHSELNLGYLTHPRSGGKGVARGNGAELRSDEHVALRAAKGILLTAWQRLHAVDSQLARAEYLSLMEQCLEQFRSLGNYAAEHQALPLDEQAQAELQTKLKQWENGGNTAAEGDGGGAALIGISVPDGISFATPKTIVSYTGGNTDSVAQQHMQLTAGQRFNLNAGHGISLFSHHHGIKAIAHHGKLLMQSQHDDTEINAAKNVKISASDSKIVLMAKEIQLIAEDGSFIKIGGGITLGSNGDIKNLSARFMTDGPATMHTELPAFPGGAPDQQFILQYGAHTGAAAIAPNRAFEIEMSDGSTVKGISDAMGKTGILQRDAMHIAHVRILTDQE
ncbi:rhs element Vgr family protein [Janthinobacterium agaricidamnosum NBRC 102515 = DSM 9628]|uniref:Rhs element Vgr family protein n=2 Tax=Janthinobacterium agaricidamnosum TaxID=55508 RepID=W0UXU0_9BURK|nr:type VI secretion system Vgr family protein [Janthinobacterium agaricidamnosum]CDG81369.1 rhs element Vgr family protein [Janthinobacterium agaricidamnosum NBRC 102515 = DSM 9628]